MGFYHWALSKWGSLAPFERKVFELYALLLENVLMFPLFKRVFTV